MAYEYHYQNNFTSGEISPSLQARTDLKQYENSVSGLTNFIVRPQGGLLKRPGTYFVSEVKNSANATRLIPFQFSTTQAYMLEVGGGYIRFYKNGGQIVSTRTITNGTFQGSLTGWTTRNTGTGTATWISNNDARIAGGASGQGAIYQIIPYIGIETYTISVTVANNGCNYSLGVSPGDNSLGSGFLGTGARTINVTLTAAVDNLYLQFSNPNNNNCDLSSVSITQPIYSIENPFAANEVDAIKFAQSYDVLFFVHPNHAPYSITRFNHDKWSNGNVNFLDGPYFDLTDTTYGGTGTGFTMTPAATTGAAVTFNCNGFVFAPTDVGRPIRYRASSTGTWGWGTIVTYTSATTVSVNIQATLDGVAASKQWRLGSWSGAANTGYPSCCTFHEQRFVFGGSVGQQSTIWFSQAGELLDFSPDSDNKDNTTDATAMTYTIADSQANVVQWLQSHNLLYLGTSGGVWVAGTQGNNNPLTPSTISIHKGIDEISSDTDPMVFRSSLLYAGYYGRRLLEATYSYITNLYTASDLAILSEQRTKGQIVWNAKQMSPNYVMWFTMEDGTTSTLTYMKDQTITAWGQQVFGGTNAIVNSIASIPGPLEDQVWFILQRTIGGLTKQYIEYLSPTFLDDTTMANCNFLDCSGTYSGVATNTISGLTYLVGQTVQVFDTQGFQIPVTGVVSNAGVVTLAAGATTTSCVVGLPYTSSFQTNEIVFTGNGTQSVGRVTRISQVMLKVFNTYGGKIGINTNTADTIPMLNSGTVMGRSVNLLTGNIIVTVPTPFSRQPYIYFEHDLPLPCHILGLTFRATVSDK